MRNAFPSLLSHALILVRKPPSHSHQQRNRMLGHRVVIDTGSRCDDHSTAVASLQINGIKTDTRPSDDSQILQRFDHPIAVGFRTGNNRIGPLQHLDQLDSIKHTSIPRNHIHIESRVTQDFEVGTVFGIQRSTDDSWHELLILLKTS
jgi:hypothetical protein